LVFTLYRRPDVSDQELAEDTKSVEKDLAKLKTLLENKFPSINRNPGLELSYALQYSPKSDGTASMKEPDNDEDPEDFRSSIKHGDRFVR
jgi:hypothetical protein